MKLRPSTVRALDEFGFKSTTDVQNSVMNSLRDACDVLCQARGATGKTSTIGIIISERIVGEGIYFTVVPSLLLKMELLRFLRRFLGFDSVEVLDVVESHSVTSRTSIFVGLPNEFLQSTGFLGTRKPRLIMMDEADGLFDTPSMMNELLTHFLTPSTKTLSLSATFPPYILTRIEEALVAADDTRLDEPTRIHQCVSTSTCATMNPVRDHVSYYYSILGQDDSLTDLVQSILTNHTHRRALIVNCSLNDAQTITELSHAKTVLLVDPSTPPADLSQISQTVIVDPQGLLSRGVNIPDLDLGISVGVHESKETILHQWARVGRQPDSSVDPKFFMVLSGEDEMDQLRFLEFQLGVSFRLYNPNDLLRIAPTHPFHVWDTMEDRLASVSALVVRNS